MYPAVAIYVAILGLLAAVLTINVIRHRVAQNIQMGDGGHEGLRQALRAQGNFIEQAPMMLILLASAEGAGARIWLVHGIGIALLLARFASAVALTQTLTQTPLRQASGGLSVLLLIVTSIVLLLTMAGIR